MGGFFHRSKKISAYYSTASSLTLGWPWKIWLVVNRRLFSSKTDFYGHEALKCWLFWRVNSNWIFCLNLWIDKPQRRFSATSQPFDNFSFPFQCCAGLEEDTWNVLSCQPTVTNLIINKMLFIEIGLNKRMKTVRGSTNYHSALRLTFSSLFTTRM